MFHDLDSTLTAILDDGTAPTELRDAADVSFETPDRNFAPGQPMVNLFLYLPERFKDFRVFAQEIWHDSISGKIQCLQRLQTQ